MKKSLFKRMSKQNLQGKKSSQKINSLTQYFGITHYSRRLLDFAKHFFAMSFSLSSFTPPPKKTAPCRMIPTPHLIQVQIEQE